MSWLVSPFGRKSFRESEEGTIAIVFALTATIAIGVVGGAVDFGHAFRERVKLQASVDAAAMAGARAIALNIGDAETTAKNTFSANYTLAAGAAPTVSVNGSRVDVSAAIGLQTHLLQLLGIPTLNLSASSAAAPAFQTVVTPVVPGGNVCILLLDSYKQNSLNVGSSATTVSAPTCEVHVKSTRTDAAYFHTNGTFDVAKSCVEGGHTTVGAGQGLIGPIEPNCTTVSDPFAGTLPVPTIGTCKSKPNLKNNVTLTPGTFCGRWHFKGDVTLTPGVYVLNSAEWKFSTRISGSGVTLYFANSNSYLNMMGQGVIDIQAPTSGTYEGILMYEPHNIPSITEQKVNGGQDAIIKGLIYMPSRDMVWNGNSGLQSDQLTMVLNSLKVTGNTTWRVEPFETFAVQAVGSGGEAVQVMSSIKLLDN